MELKFDITEEQIEEALRDAANARIGEAVECRYGSMRKAVEHFLEEEIGKLVQQEAEERFDAIVEEVVTDFMAKPVVLSDGWGYSEKKYDTYADFIGARLRDKFSRDYSLRDEFKKQLEAKVEKVWDEYKKDAIATMLAKANALSKAE